jgi:hypothetical protein
VGTGLSSNVHPPFIKNLSQPVRRSISFFSHLDYHSSGNTQLCGVGPPSR